MRWWIYGLAGALVVSALRGRAEPPGEPTAEIQAVRALARRAGMTDPWADFMALAAHGESRGNPASRNIAPGEVEASRVAYQRNAQNFAACGRDPAEYVIGSGGLFGMLPANGVMQLPASHRCIDPARIVDPEVAIAMAAGFARGLMRYDGFARSPTWLNLRHGWHWPGRMGDRTELRRVRPTYVEHAGLVGLPARWLEGTPPGRPPSSVEVIERLGVPA